MGLRESRAQYVLDSLLLIDVIQLCLNPIFHHAFTTTLVMVEGGVYFSLVPRVGQTFHRVVDYSIFLGTVVAFVHKTVHSPRVYVERYLVILLSMLVGGIWQSYYIFSGIPVDRSMIAFGAFGLAVFYFTIYYRPRRLLDRLLAQVVSDMREALVFFDDEGVCIFANDRAGRLLGFDVMEEQSHTRTLFVDLADGAGVEDAFGDWQADVDADVGDGLRSYRVTCQPIRETNGRRAGSCITLRDRTEEELRLRNQTYLANHDPPTGLYSQAHLIERARAAIDAAEGEPYVVAVLDVRDFKMINDVFSREIGDKVICRIAGFLRTHATDNMMFGRLGGDRFAIVAPEREFCGVDFEHLLAHARFMGEGNNYPLVVHMGVYYVREPSLSVSVMFDRAFMAIDSIKSDYGRHVAVYDDVMRDDVIWSQKISGELAGAIESGDIRPYLQPMVDAEGRVIGAEILCRWMHREEGFLSPARFVPVFEKNGMIARLDAHMWRCACSILAQWEARGIDLFLSVNISPKDFYFIDVEQTLLSLVDEYGVDPNHLRLEITETVMMSDVEQRLQMFEKLRAQGFLIEMDDFGSGYSSLNLLKDMPVDVLKIDMMFLYKTKDHKKAQTILQNIINLSCDLGIPSLTEGVETEGQRDMLVDMGCTMFQGYYFARPMPYADFESYCDIAFEVTAPVA